MTDDHCESLDVRLMASLKSLGWRILTDNEKEIYIIPGGSSGGDLRVRTKMIYLFYVIFQISSSNNSVSFFRALNILDQSVNYLIILR